MKDGERIPVRIPDDKGVHLKSAGSRGEKYVYKYTKYYRNSEGKPRNKSVCIGKVSPQPGMMVPNDNYFALYHVSPALPDVIVRDYGYTWLFRKVCRDTGLLRVLSEVFRSRADAMIAVAAYVLLEGNSLDHLPEWQERSYLPGADSRITAREANRLFASVTPEERLAFFRLWGDLHRAGRCACYEVAAVSSCAALLPELERGDGGGHEHPARFYLDVFCDEETRMPLYYHQDNSSLTAQGSLSRVLAGAQEAGIRRVRLFLDGGLWSGDWISSLRGACEAFTVGMPVSLAPAQAAIEQCRGSIERQGNECSNAQVYCMSVPSALYGVEGRILVCYDPWIRASLCGGPAEDISRSEAELRQSGRCPEPDGFRRDFRPTGHGTDGGSGCGADTERTGHLRRNQGFSLWFTTERETPADELLDYYRVKDDEERLFAQVRVDADGGRARMPDGKTTDGKVFVMFLAGIVRSCLLEKLRQSPGGRAASLSSALHELSNLRTVECNGERRFTGALTGRQREILRQFGAEEAILSGLDP